MKKFFITSVILLIALLILGFIPFRRNIARTETVQILEDLSSGTAAETVIKMEGTYSFYLLRPDRFTGKIEIGAFPETAGKEVDCTVAEPFPSSLIYRSWTGSVLNSDFFGLIKTGVGMKKMILFHSDDDGGISLNGEGTCVILSGGASAEDARNLLDKMEKAE